MMQQVSPKVQLQEGDSLTVIVAHAGEEREYTITFSSSTKEKLCAEWKQQILVYCNAVCTILLCFEKCLFTKATNKNTYFTYYVSVIIHCYG